MLTIDICHKIAYNNGTPAHEAFHLFQSGYTEGTARWAENAINRGSGFVRGNPLPSGVKGRKANDF